MRRLLLLLALLPITLVKLAAAPQANESASEPRKISADELKRMLDEKTKFFFLDVREPKELEELGTIKGYVNIPMSQLETRISEIPKDVFVVVA